MKSGVYRIMNKLNGNLYIGSSLNILKRFSKHKEDLRKNKHHSVYLQRAWNKYGEDAFTFAPVMSCLPAELIVFEQDWLDAMEPEYNICKVAGSALGVRRTEQTKEKISLSRVGNKYCVGRKYNTDTLRKMSESHKGKPNPRRNTGKGYSWVDNKKLWRASWVNLSGKRIVKRFKCEERAIAWLAERRASND